MYSKKEEFTNTIQFLIGERIEDLESSSYTTIEELSELFQAKSNKTSWKSLHFLVIFYKLKSKIEELTSTKSILSSTDLNLVLNKAQKDELVDFMKVNQIRPPEFERPPMIERIVFLFPVPAILGTMLICTYYITKYDYSGWLYLLGLVGVVLSALLIILTAPFRNKFKSSTLVDYAKLTYTIGHKKHVETSNSKAQLLQFLTDELENEFGKRLTPTETIPEN